ncbi:MAG: rhomboid family intramembrane serine protease [Cyclobacteriaceae bacterium]
MGKDSPGLWGSSILPARLVFLMWAAFVLQYVYGFNLTTLGIQPRTLTGLIGIFTAPIIHASRAHLVSNTIPLLFLGTTLFFFYERIGRTVFFRCYFFTNILVWLLSPRISYHIGASGLIYGLSAFLIFYGLLRKDFLSLLISIGVIIAYGGIFYGILPTDSGVSWESHLAGAIVGTATAFNLRNKKNIG